MDRTLPPPSRLRSLRAGTDREVAVGGSVRIALALLAAAAGVIHLAVVREHLEEDALYGLFFLTLAAAQFAWASAVLLRPSRGLLLVGGLASAAVVALWAVAHTVGLPFGPEPGAGEATGLIDVVSSLFEVLTAAGTFALLRPHVADRAVSRDSSGLVLWVLTLVAVPLTLFVISGGGHDHGAAVGHAHGPAEILFHVTAIGGAALVFAGYVARDAGLRLRRPRRALAVPQPESVTMAA